MMITETTAVTQFIDLGNKDVRQEVLN